MRFRFETLIAAAVAFLISISQIATVEARDLIDPDLFERKIAMKLVYAAAVAALTILPSSGHAAN